MTSKQGNSVTMGIFLKHGYIPTVGISMHIMRPTDNPYKSFRIGLYWIMIEFDSHHISLLWHGKGMYTWEWYSKLTPKIRMTVKNNNIIWERDSKFIGKGKKKKIVYFWKRVK